MTSEKTSDLRMAVLWAAATKVDTEVDVGDEPARHQHAAAIWESRPNPLDILTVPWLPRTIICPVFGSKSCADYVIYFKQKHLVNGAGA